MGIIALKVKSMKALPSLTPKSTPGFQVQRLRMFDLLSRQELADLAGVPLEHVDLFEQDLPLPLDSKRKMLKTLWAIKIKK
jgi:DNA-binding transcriptional regulator YiaG